MASQMTSVFGILKLSVSENRGRCIESATIRKLSTDKGSKCFADKVNIIKQNKKKGKSR